MIANNTRRLVRDYEREHEAMQKAVMPKTGVVEYDDLLVRVPLTGWTWREGKRVQAEGGR